MTEDHRYSVSVAGVIVDDEGRALIIQRRDNIHWEPPGGVLEHGETIEDGLRREVYEETGLKIEQQRLTGVYQNMERHIVALVFQCKRIAGNLSVNNEVIDFRWVDAADALTLMAPAYAARVVDAISSTPTPLLRAHNGSDLI
jgi:8-oxo-dGTP diphosphatase